MNYRSFVDVLFILLLGSIVMLSQSIQLDALELSPAEVGSGGASSLRADEVRLVVVGENGLELDGERFAGTESLGRSIGFDEPVLLVARRARVSHERVMTVWSELESLGFEVSLGVAPEGSLRDLASIESEPGA